MLRLQIAQLLRGDGVMQAILPGGIYPTAEVQASALTKRDHPAAFDPIGQVVPSLLVQDGGMFALPTTSRTMADTFEVIVWQQRGRDAIGGALARAFLLLDGATFGVGASWVYELRCAGEGPNVRDQALGDAEQGRSRWQATLLR